MPLRATPPDTHGDSLVMVVDDELDVAEMTASMLEGRGMETVTETGPEDALEAFDEQVACVVSDYQMPEMNGLELLTELRHDHPDVRFVLFTGRGSETVASEAIDAGADHYLQKGRPEQYDRLANCVETLVEKFHEERALRKRRQQFETIFENAFDGIFILDVDAVAIVDANPRACELLEYPYEELVGTSVAEIHPEDYEEYLAIGRDLIDSGRRRRVQSACYTRHGEVIHSDITAAPMEYDDRTFLLTIMRPQ